MGSLLIVEIIVCISLYRGHPCLRSFYPERVNGEIRILCLFFGRFSQRSKSWELRGHCKRVGLGEFRVTHRKAYSKSRSVDYWNTHRKIVKFIGVGIQSYTNIPRLYLGLKFFPQLLRSCHHAIAVAATQARRSSAWSPLQPPGYRQHCTVTSSPTHHHQERERTGKRGRKRRHNNSPQ